MIERKDDIAKFTSETENLDFDSIRLRIASPETILSWSHGEITKPETINYRTQKPEKDGLFDERIFGPSKDWECYCGKYKKIRYKGIICDKCGVEVTIALVRRERMGHITLQSPVSHIWFLRGVPSKIGITLDMSLQSLERVIYCADFIITSVNENLKTETLAKLRDEFKSKKKQIANDFERTSANLKAGSAEWKKEEDEKNKRLLVLTEEFTETEADLKGIDPLKVISEHSYHELSIKYGHLFDASIGAEAIRELLARIDLKKTLTLIEKGLPEAPPARRDRMIRRAKLLRNLDRNNIKPEWMIISHLPVLPPDLRPMVALDGGRFATSDLNDLYRRVINRNNRLRRLMELRAPEVITRNEKRMLQEAVDALIDNSARHTKTVTASTGQKRSLRSLADILKGKQGRFRQNLLGKRVDYSGRSVIVVGPSLKLHQCGLPKRMALELFKPFIMARLIKEGVVHNVRSASRYIENDHTEVWNILEEITSQSLVLLNRAPTLHRLSIQAFQPVLIEGKAIQVHPLVCPAFNADFDGDQMAVHVPLTEEAKKEAFERMLSTKNLLKPATGFPVANPNKDIAWGCYYLTSSLVEPERIQSFPSSKEALLAQDIGLVGLHEKIKVRGVRGYDGLCETTVGRLIFNRLLPERLPFYNHAMDVKKLGEMTRLCLEFYGPEKTSELLDALKETGFRCITLSGYSWSMEDLPNLPIKQELLKQGAKEVEEVKQQYLDGLLTNAERHSKIIGIWMTIKDQVVKQVKASLSRESSIFTMVDSGARGSWGQVTQMVGMKGPVANPAGEIIELPIKASFKEGLSVLEFFISTHGSRKGLSDTALRTANAGYLTRRLVDVSQDVVIRKDDCGDTEGMMITRADSEEMGENIAHRLIGRTTLEDINHPETGKVLIKKGDMVTEESGRILENHPVESVRVRSALRCKAVKGLCAACYGFDLSYNKPVKHGVAVGIMAAQSIGEPGTQLTMRTFHTGGVAGLDITQGLPRVEELFEARMPKRKGFMADMAGSVKIETGERVVEENGRKVLVGQSGQKIIKITCEETGEERYMLQENDDILKQDGDLVEPDEVILRRAIGDEVKAVHRGTIKKGKKEISVEFSGTQVKEFIIPPGYVLWVKDGDQVAVGAQLTEGHLDPQELYRLKGRPAVEEYFLKGVQSIYSSQGQKLNDKHIEVIVRQMFSRISVSDGGDTNLLAGDVVERSEFEEENRRAGKKGKPATGETLLLGITKVALSTRSFLSSASFQETAKVLINAAITGKIDTLEGLKENVIIGRLIPAGTGFIPDEK
ncbi:MAG: DNA-directed RNA polymerase subunit beta' [Patescibacteria group bacterium]